MSKLEMKVPSPGESISEVEIATWLVSDGDYVEKDQAIAEVDSDKATLELPAEAAGVITLKAEEGELIAVGDVCCLIDTDAKPPKGAKKATPVKAVEAPVEVKLTPEANSAPVAAPVSTGSVSTRIAFNAAIINCSGLSIRSQYLLTGLKALFALIL